MSAYPIRMTFIYKSLDPNDLDLTLRNGFNWICTGWLGHNESPPDDQPVLFEQDQKVAELRRPRFDKIREHITDLRAFHEEAHRRGLKVALFSYEPSVPAEIRQAYPEAFYPFPEQYLKLWPKDRDRLHMCIYDGRTQEWIAEKVRQTIGNVGPIDAWIYTTAEAMWGSNCNRHVCAYCAGKPRWESLRLLRDAMQEGVRRCGQCVTLIHRFWGTQHPDGYMTGASTFHRLTPHDKPLQRAHIEGIEPFIFRPSRDLPRFYDSLLAESSPPTITSKATWTDFLLQQPTNPWLGRCKGQISELIELSIESCHQKFYGFIPCCVLRQLQRHLKLGLEKGATGVILTPLEADRDWGLNIANVEVTARLIEDPDQDVKVLLKHWSASRYGESFPDWLIDAMLATEDIWADIVSFNGMSNLMNFDTARFGWSYMLGTSKYYLWPMLEAFPDAAQRLDLSQEGFGRAIATWNRRVAEARKLHQRVEQELSSLPASARETTRFYFERLAQLTLFTSLLQKLTFARMGLEFRKLEPTMQLIRLMERWEMQVYYLIASDPEIQQSSIVGKPQYRMSGWQYPDVTEADMFPQAANARETVPCGFVGEWAEVLHEKD
jgi:hypothetical protein